MHRAPATHSRHHEARPHLKFARRAISGQNVAVIIIENDASQLDTHDANISDCTSRRDEFLTRRLVSQVDFKKRVSSGNLTILKIHYAVLNG